MNFTLWVLGLAGLGAILFFGRRRWEKTRDSKQNDQMKKKLDAEQAEIDRLACLDLGKSLMSSVPSSGRSGPSSAAGPSKSGH